MGFFGFVGLCPIRPVMTDSAEVSDYPQPADKLHCACVAESVSPAHTTLSSTLHGQEGEVRDWPVILENLFIQRGLLD